MVEIGQHLLDLPGVDLGDGLVAIGAKDQLGPSASRQSNRACRSSARTTGRRSTGDLRGVLARAKSRSCRMIVVILSASGLIAAALCGDLVPRRACRSRSAPPGRRRRSAACPVHGRCPRPAGRRFSSDRRGEVAPGRRSGRPFPRAPEPATRPSRAHRVQALGQFRQLIARAKVHGLAQISGGDPPCLWPQQPERLRPRRRTPSTAASSRLRASFRRPAIRCAR